MWLTNVLPKAPRPLASARGAYSANHDRVRCAMRRTPVLKLEWLSYAWWLGKVGPPYPQYFVFGGVKVDSAESYNTLASFDFSTKAWTTFTATAASPPARSRTAASTAASGQS